MTYKLNEYRNDLREAILRPGVASDVAASTVQAWYTSKGRDQFSAAFEHETALRLVSVNRSDKALIEQGFPKNVNEYAGKTAWAQYYIANALIAFQELDKLLKDIGPFPKGLPEVWYRNIAELAGKLLLDTLVLIDDWAVFKAQVPGVIGIGKNRYEHGVNIYHAALQVIYGNCSPFAASHNYSDTAVNQLRMAIEMRLRRGFGILAKLDRSGAIVPLPLSELIEAIRIHRSDIDLAIPLEHIERLYGWANIYMHSGLKQYTWSPMFALSYLRPFLLGGKYPGGTSVYAGIRAKYGVIKRVQSNVESRIDKARYSLLIVDPSECDLILRT